MIWLLKFMLCFALKREGGSEEDGESDDGGREDSRFSRIIQAVGFMPSTIGFIVV